MSLEQLGPSSAGAIARLHAQCFEPGWSEREFASLLHLPANHLCAWRPKGEIQGFVLCRQALDEAEILTICVAPSARGKGLGLKLIERAHHDLSKNGIARLFLEVSTANIPARRLYDQAGYSEIGRRKAYYRDGNDALVLEKTLIERGQD